MRRSVAIAGMSLGLVAFGLRSISPASAAAICGPSWSEVSSPSVNAGDNHLTAVAAVADSDVWAVGYSVKVDENLQYVNSTLIEHWDGQAWSIVSSPNQGAGSNSLNGMAAVSATDVCRSSGDPDGPASKSVPTTRWHARPDERLRHERDCQYLARGQKYAQYPFPREGLSPASWER